MPAESAQLPPRGWIEWVWDFPAGCARWSGALSDADLPASPVTGASSLLALVHPEDRERIGREFTRALANGGSLALEHRLKGTGDAWRWVTNAATIALDEARRPTSARGVVVDIHASHGDVGKLERLRRLYQVLLAVNQAMVKVGTIEGLLAETCQVLVEHGRFAGARAIAFGADGPRLAASAGDGQGTLDELLRTRPLDELERLFERFRDVWSSNDLVHDPRLAAVSGLAALADGRSAALVPINGPGGALSVITLRSGPRIAFDEEEIALLRQLGADVTFSVTTLGHQRVLREQEARYRSVFEHASDGIFLADAKGRYVDANDAALDLVGYTRAELRTKGVGDLLPSDELPRAGELVPGRALLRERPLTRKDGSLVFVELAARRLPDGSLLSIVRKLEDRRRFESQLQLTDRLVSLGTLAGGVAHELNNPLSWIISDLTQARELVQELGAAVPAEARRELDELLAESLEGANRIVTVVSDLRTFTRPDTPHTRVVLQQVLERAAKMVAIQARYRGTLTTSFGATPDVPGSESQLTQVFVNLMLNAVQSLPEGRPERNKVEVLSSTDASGNAQVEVRDSGAGIAPDYLRRIFDPFFTTKPLGVGTGLGLTVVFNIVSQLGGTVDVKSIVGVGTSVFVTLPPAPDSPLPGSSTMTDD